MSSDPLDEFYESNRQKLTDRALRRIDANIALKLQLENNPEKLWEIWWPAWLEALLDEAREMPMASN